ncbi:hypothetical protein B4U79_10686, partial [Dinothrombium tinctorium]
MNGKVVLITGSSSGTGAVTAQEFAKLGAKLVITGRNVQGVKNTADACAKLSPQGYKPLEIICDLDKDEDVRKLINKTIDYFGKLDILIGFHGIGDMTSYDTPNLMEVYDRVMRTNLRANVYLCHLAIPHLIKTKGNIILMSSIGAEKPYDHDMAFCMANAAVDLFARYIAVRLAPKGVRVNTIRPTYMVTPSKVSIFHKMGMKDEEIKEMWEYLEKENPMQRNLTSYDVANVTVFLASDKASFVNGVNLKIDGGHSDVTVAATTG